MDENVKMLVEAALHERERFDADSDALEGYAVADLPAPLYAAQQWAGTYDAVVSASTRPLLRLQLPRQYARPWTVHFGAPQLNAAGQALGIGVFRPSVAGMVVTLRWGIHGTVEEVQMRWPSLGGALTVFASYLELTVDNNSAANLFTPPQPQNVARVSAWLNEGRQVLTDRRGLGAVWSEYLGNIAALGSAVGRFVPRARAWTLTWASNTVIAPSPNVILRDNGTTLQFMIFADTDQAKQVLVPILTQANLYEVSNNDTLDPMNNTIMHQYLDLG